MNAKSWIPLVAAVVLGLIALVVARKALEKGGGGEAEKPLVGVAVAKRDVPPGRELSAEDITVSRVATDHVPPQSFKTPQELIGRTTLYPLIKDQAIVDQLLAPTGMRGGLSVLIPQGYRAMTLEVNEFTGLAGMIVPSAKVDIIAVLRDEKSGQPAARTVLQNIEVRAVGRNYNPAPPAEGAQQPQPSNNVTLLVTPKQAQTLQLVSQNGRPWLVLRGGRDTKEVEAEVTTLAKLRNDSTEIGATEPATRPTTGVAATPTGDPFGMPHILPTARVVQIIRGGVESTISFPDTPNHPPASGGSGTVTPATQPVKPGNDGRFFTGADPRPLP